MKYKAIVAQVNEILKQYSYPVTLRQVYYRLVAAGVIENTQSNYNYLSKQLVRARERGEVDYRKIEDRGRNTIKDLFAIQGPAELYEEIASMVDYHVSNYKRNPWLDQDSYVEVWVEKDALSRVVSQVATDEYSVVVAPNRGYGGYTFVRDGAERIESSDNKSLHIIYLGDFDPSGEDMVRDLRYRMARYGTGDRVVKVHKIALTKEQIREYKIPEDLAKPSDARTRTFVERHGEKTAELDALPPEILQQLVREAIEKYIDPVKWKETRDKTLADKKEIAPVIRSLKEVLQAT